MSKKLHKRDSLRLLLRPDAIKTIKVGEDDVGKIFVLTSGKAEAKIMTREKFLALSISSIGGWCEVDEFDVNA